MNNLIHNFKKPLFSKVLILFIINIVFLTPTLVGAVDLTPPISSTSIPELIQKLIDILVQIGMPIAALFIVWAGLQFVTAGGNESKLSQSRTTLWMTLLGAAILLGAKVIADTLAETIKGL